MLSLLLCITVNIPKETKGKDQPFFQWSKSILEIKEKGFPGGSVVKNLPANAGDMGSSPGPGRSHMPRSK